VFLCLFLLPVPRRSLVGVVVWLMGLLFENYIVDASIEDACCAGSFGLVGCVFLQQFLMNEPGPCGHGSLE